MKRCPHCAEEIQDEAKVCRYCQRDLNPLAAPIPRPEPVRKGNKAWWLLVPVGFLMSFFGGGLLGPGGVGFFLMWVATAFAGTGTAGTRWVGGFVLALVFMLPSFIASMPATTPAGADTRLFSSSPSEPAEKLELLAANGTLGERYNEVHGQVKNLTSEPIDNIKVVVSWLSASGEFITSDSALIDYRPLMPGQTSPFSTMTSANPLMKKYRVEFSTMRGATIGFRDSRK